MKTLRIIFNIIFLTVITLLFFIGCNSSLNEATSSILIGQVLFDDFTGNTKPASGTKISLIQNNSIISSQIVSEEGNFQLTNLQPGIYDLLFETNEQYVPDKIADYKITYGLNKLNNPVLMYPYKSNSDSIYITIEFKKNIPDNQIQNLIVESQCELFGQSSSLLYPGVKLYVLKIHSTKGQLFMIQFFLRRTIVLKVMAGAVTLIN